MSRVGHSRSHNVTLIKVFVFILRSPPTSLVMGRFQATTSRELRKKVEHELLHRRKLAAASASLAGHAVIQYADPLFNKTPMHTSILSGEGRMQELLNGHPVSFYNEFGMTINVFNHLLRELVQYTSFCASKHVSAIEQLGIFLWICRKGAPVRDAMYHFQRSPDTVSKCVLCYLMQLILSNLIFLGIFTVFYIVLHQHDFISDMSSFLLLIGHLHPSWRIQSSILSLRMSLELLMAHTLMLLSMMLTFLVSATGKALLLRMCLLPVLWKVECHLS